MASVPMFLDPEPQRLLDDFLARKGAPGGALTILQNGIETSYVSGTADLASGAPVTTASLFEVGSQTKMMTAVTTLRLVAEGEVELDAPIARYVDADDLAGIANAGDATVRQLLAMSSGMPNYTDVTTASGELSFVQWMDDHPGRYLGADESLDLVRGLAAGFEPGASYDYSNTNYVLLGRMIENVTGQSLETAFRERVFLPAGMSDTTLQRFPIDSDRTEGYAGGDFVGQLVPTNGYLWNPGPEGGAISQSDDMARFVDALLDDSTLLSADLVDFMVDGGVTGPQGSTTYGLGIFTLDGLDFGTPTGHDGGTLGANSVTMHIPELDVTISIATNLSGSSPTELLGEVVNFIRTDLGWGYWHRDII